MQFVQRVAARPFHYYFRAASVGFGLTLVSNMSSSVANVGDISIYKNPVMSMMGIFSKSCFFGVLWPIIPFSIACRPQNYFVLGQGLKQVALWLDQELAEPDELDDGTKDNK